MKILPLTRMFDWVFRRRGRKTGQREAEEQFCSPDRIFPAAHGFG